MVDGGWIGTELPLLLYNGVESMHNIHRCFFFPFLYSNKLTERIIVVVAARDWYQKKELKKNSDT